MECTLPLSLSDLSDLEVEIAKGVAKGDLHPMTKAPITGITEDKENAKTSFPPKEPTPSKSIKSFFKPNRSNSLRDITPTITKADEQKANTPPPKHTPLNTSKRPFTADAGADSIAVKRARKYLTSDEETEVVASPFFSKSTSTIHTSVAAGEKHEPLIVDTNESMEAIATVQMLENTEVGQNTENEPQESTVTHTVIDLETPESQETQVSESPPRTKPSESIRIDLDEIIPNSPNCPIRAGNFLESQQSDEKENLEIPASPGCETNEDIFPPSPPPSRPVSALFLSRASHHQYKTPIMHPGIKKAYTPRPSHSIFPETPTPSPVLSQQHSLVVKAWKERFLHNSASQGLFTPKNNDTPKLRDTISSRPMTPLHTPLLRRNHTTTKATTPINRPATTENSRRSTVMDDHIEKTSPPNKGRSSFLDRFRFLAQ